MQPCNEWVITSSQCPLLYHLRLTANSRHSDYTSPKMLLLSLRGLHVPMSYRLVRERLLHVSGLVAYSHLLRTIACKDPLNLAILILQTLDDFLEDTDVCETVHDAGVTSQLFDLVPRCHTSKWFPVET
jgi:hypothetical protein